MSSMPPPDSLDPKDWDELRTLAHSMLDDALTYAQDVRERPVWQAMPNRTLDTFRAPAPLDPTPLAEVYQEFKEHILPYPMGNIHPRFWAWYMGNGTVTGALADFLAGIMNPNLGGGSHAAAKVEAQVVNWMKDLARFPAEASGLLTSGASMANFIALAVARDRRAGANVREQGLFGTPRPPTVYASSEVHSCNEKALALLGLGTRQLRKVPVKDDFTMNVQVLRQMLADDRAAGCNPICVIGTAGTVNSGAVDDLASLADLCAEQDLWFHVDGAIGAVAMLSDRIRPSLAGLERADSIALDLHKWMHIPFEAGCALVRHAEAHRHTFALVPEYLEHGERGLAGESLWFSDYGLQLTRQFRALKVWMSIKEHGLRRFGAMMTRNLEQAEYLADLVDRHPHLERTAPVSLNIVCFRYNPGGLTEPALEDLNHRILIRLQESGVAAPSDTRLRDRYCLRVAIVNHRTRQDDLDLLVSEILRIGSADDAYHCCSR